MQLKQESGADPRKKFLMVRKFSRAALWAKQLSKLSESVGVDARTKLETEVRTLLFMWQHGLNFERSRKLHLAVPELQVGVCQHVFRERLSVLAAFICLE